MIDDIHSHVPHIPVKNQPLNDDEGEQSDIETLNLAESDFQTPEQVAADESADNSAVPPPPRSGKKPEATPWWSWKYWQQKWRTLSKKQKIMVLAATAGVLLIGGTAAGLALTRHAPVKPIVKLQPKPKPPPAPTTVPSTLTGLPVALDVNQRPVTGVMIENSIDARPQSGLDQAGVVFEAIAEGGITRFLALYQDTQPAYLGPVRSVRPYYLQWCLSFDCSIAHVGGSPEALNNDIPSWHVKDLDQFANGGSYQRITSRAAPHNVYTSIAQLNQLEASKGFGASHFSGFNRKKDQPTKTPPAARTIDLAISSALYNVHYDYDPTLNAYHRSEGGQGHVVVDQAGTPTQIIPKVVVALVMQQGIEPDDQHTAYGTLGSAQAYIFQDGNLIIGTWHKAGNADPITLTDAQNKPIPLNAGQTWISVLGAATSISYAP